jgi:hypothetical protein
MGAQGDPERLGSSNASSYPPRPLLFLLTIALTWAALSAKADPVAHEMRCFLATSAAVTSPGEFTSAFAGLANEKTSTGSGTETESQGWNFDANSDEILICSTTIPAIYDDAGTPPTVMVSGWGVSDQFCLDGSSKTVIFGVSSRAYSHGDQVNKSWSAEDTGTITIPCSTSACGGLNCNRGQFLRQTGGDASPNASDWTGGDVVFVKIRRDTTSDTYSHDFHVASVELSFDETP